MNVDTLPETEQPKAEHPISSTKWQKRLSDGFCIASILLSISVIFISVTSKIQPPSTATQVQTIK